MSTASQNRFLILQHEWDCPPGSLLPWLEKNNFSYRVIYVPEFKEWDSGLEKNFEHLVILGGAPNVDQELQYSWLVPEKKFISNFIHSLKDRRKVLGLCLGSQLIAEVLGARVGPSPHWEYGWHEVQCSYPHPEKLNAFHWHGYESDLPVGAQRIALSELCQNQGYIWKNSVMGLQFHPEATKEWIFESVRESLPPKAGKGVQSSQEILDTVNMQFPLQIWFHNLLNSFYLS